jgi:hypothetical protein
MIAILITNKNSLKKSSGPASGPDERTDLRELRVGPTARAPPPRPRLPLFIKSSKPGSSGSHLCKQEFEALPGGVLSLSIHICSQLPAQCVSLDFLCCVSCCAFASVFFCFSFLLGLVAFQDLRRPHKFALKRVRFAGFSFVCSCRIRGARRDRTKQGR